MIHIRLLFSVLKKMQSGVTPASKEYKLSESEFIGFLSFMENKGYLRSVKKLGLHSNHTYETTPKGAAFLEEHKHFQLEMPEDEEEIPHWVRFEGTVYKPNTKAGSSAVNHHHSVKLIDYTQWTNHFEIALEASAQRKGTGFLNIGAQATEDEIASVEAELGLTLPESFKSVLLGCSKRIHFFWHVPASEAYILNHEESKIHIQAGGLFDDGLWDLDKLAEYNAMREDLDYMDDDYKRHWAFSLAFARDGMGNYYALDLKYNVGEVIYLAHDGYYHGWRLGQDFESFFDNWIRIGCAGSFVTDFIAFSAQDSPYLSEKSANSNALKEWLTSK